MKKMLIVNRCHRVRSLRDAAAAAAQHPAIPLVCGQTWHWLFPERNPDDPVSVATLQEACRRAP